MSLLTLVQTAAMRVGIQKPLAVASSTDPQIQQLMALACEEGQELGERGQWQALLKEAVFTTVNTAIQGSLDTICPGMKYIINETIWNRDLRRPVFGPLSAQRMQQMKAMVMQGPWNQYKVVAGNIEFIPAPAAGQTCAFYYITRNWAVAADGTTKSSYTLDDDVSLLDEDIMVLGLIWRWKAAKGFNYSQDFDKYERRVMDYLARDGSKPVLSMTANQYDIYPGVFVPAGSWGAP